MKIIRTATIGMSLDIFCRGLLTELRKDGHDVVALSSPDADLQTLGQRECVRTIGVTMARQISPLSDIRSLWKLWRVFRRERPDMVHSMTPKAGLLSMIAAALAHVPVRVHTFTGLVWPTSHGLKRRILMTTDWLTCQCATHVVPEGEGVMNDLRQGGITRKPMKVLGYGNVRGVDLDHYSRRGLPAPIALANEEAACPVFLFVGRLVGDKGVNELVGAFHRLGRGILLLVGPEEADLDPLTPTTLATLKELSGTPPLRNGQIYCAGMQTDVRPWMEMADVLILPSYREGFPNVVIEAGAMQLPTIVTDINGSREIVVPATGRIVPPRSEDALLEAMVWMADHPDERRQMGQAARVRVEERWDQHYVRQCLKQYYEEINR